MSRINRPSEIESEHGDNFVRQVWTVVCGIPSGHVLTYGEVARLAGRQNGARHVSQAMRLAPRNLRLPWHRVINAQGKIAIPEGSSGYKRQKDLLESEGVVFLNGKVDLGRYGYQGVVDKLLWGRPD